MRFINSLVVVLVLGWTPIICDAASVSSKSFNLGAVELTYRDLDEVLQRVRVLLSSANKVPSEEIALNESLTVSAGEDSLTLSKWERLDAMRALPPVARSIRYRYSSRRNAPVSEVTIWLYDGRRLIEVEGADHAQVFAVSTAVRDSFVPFSSILTGPKFRFAGAAALLLIGNTLITMPGWLRGAGKLPYFSVALGLVVLISIFALPWDEWFPGTAVYSTTASFVDRNAGLLGFIGLVLTITLPLLGLAWRRWTSSRAAKGRSGSSPQ